MRTCAVGLQRLEGVDTEEKTCDSLGGTLSKPLQVQLMQQRHPEALAGPAAGPAFHYQPIAGASHKTIHPSMESPCQAAYPHIICQWLPVMSFTPRPCQHDMCLPVSINALWPVSGGPLSVQTVKLSLDLLMLAPSSLPVASLESEVVQPAINAQLDRLQRARTADGPLCEQRALHFQPQGWPHPLTIVYPLGAGGTGMVSSMHPWLVIMHAVHSRQAPRRGGAGMVRQDRASEG